MQIIPFFDVSAPKANIARTINNIQERPSWKSMICGVLWKKEMIHVLEVIPGQNITYHFL